MPRLAALVLVVALAACSSGGSDASSSGGSTTSVAAAARSTTTSAPKPLADQSPPPSINGITIQGDTAWIASIAGDQVIQVDRRTGAILRRVSTEGAGPDDVAVAPDGSIWVAGFGNGDLGHIVAGRYEVATTIAKGINPIDVADDGTVYVGTYGPKGTLYALAPDADRAELRATDLPDINAFEVLDDGRIFAPAGGVAGPGSAVLIDPADGSVTPVADGLPGVAAATVAPDGTPYVLGNAAGQLISVDLGESTSKVVRTISQGAPFDNLAFADDGTLYLSSFTSVAITEVKPNGSVRTIPIGG